MKIILPGGSGHLGQLLSRHFERGGAEVVILSRSSRPVNGGAGCTRVVRWDGRTLGRWSEELDGADAVINLAGRSVNCRYIAANVREILESRVDSTRVIGQAIERGQEPPRVWLQASTATIYAHRFDAANDELTGLIGGDEPGVPAYWRTSIDVARAWESALEEAATPSTRKVALRSAMVMHTLPGGVFDVLLALTRLGIGGSIAGGRQYVSWIHERDFTRCIDFLLQRDDMSGPVNVTAPHPLPQREFMAALRVASGMPIGLPAAKWMVELGAVVLRTDTELLLKSRYVVPRRLLEAGFTFEFPKWPSAAQDLIARRRASRKRRAQ